MAKQGFFTEPMNFNFVWGVTGGQKFRPEVMIAMKNALPPGSNFTTCAVGIEQFPANVMSCLLGGNMRVGMEDNTRMPNGELAKGSYEQVAWAARAAESLNRKPATPAEARQIMGIRKE
jgi:3-keto-5-aminohexanoate cleavage enzyme